MKTDLGALVWGLLLEQMQNRGPIKVGGSTHIRNMGLDLDASARIALSKKLSLKFCASSAPISL
jgi:hypothetical protein